MDKIEAKSFFANYFVLDSFEQKQLATYDSYIDCACADLYPNPNGRQTFFNFFDTECLITTFPYYKGERIGNATFEYIQYSDFVKFLEENY